MRFRSILPLASLLALAACDGGGGTTEPPAGGEYRAVLVSPHGDEGAAAIELTGPGIQSVTAPAGTLWTQADGNTMRVVLVRDPAGPVELRVTTAPGQTPPAARVVEVVDRFDQPRESLAGYSVTFTR